MKIDFLKDNWTSVKPTKYFVVRDDGGKIIAEVRGVESQTLANAILLFMQLPKKIENGDIKIEGPCDEQLWHVTISGNQVCACGSHEVATDIRNALYLRAMNAEMGRHLAEKSLALMALHRELEELRIQNTQLRGVVQPELKFSVA